MTPTSPVTGLEAAFTQANIRAAHGARPTKAETVRLGNACIRIALYKECVLLRPTDHSHDEFSRLAKLFNDCIEALSNEDATRMIVAFTDDKLQKLKDANECE